MMNVNFIVVTLVLSFFYVLCQEETEDTIIKPEVINLDLPEGAKCNYYESNGTCVSAYRCLSVLVGLKFQRYPPLCSFNEDVPVICCTDCELVDDIGIATFIPSLGIYYRNRTRLSERKCLQYLDELPYSCKSSSVPKLYYDFLIPIFWPEDKTCRRLFGIDSWYGQDQVDEDTGQFPHTALLGYGPDLESAQYHCGGSVISEKYILTSGHCTGNSQLGPVKYVALGILMRTDPPELWQRYEVKRIIRHPEYRPPSKYHDIALLEVENRIIFNKKVLPACLGIDKHKYYEEVSIDPLIRKLRDALADEELGAFAIGWSSSISNRTPAFTLQKVQLKKYTDDQCSQLYQIHRYMVRGYDNITQMCYGDNTEIGDTCIGDRGVSLQVSIRANIFDCQFKVIGVVSSGNPCGTKGGAGLYTRVEYYVPWIESIVWPDE